MASQNWIIDQEDYFVRLPCGGVVVLLKQKDGQGGYAIQEEYQLLGPHPR